MPSGLPSSIAGYRLWRRTLTRREPLSCQCIKTPDRPHMHSKHQYPTIMHASTSQVILVVAFLYATVSALPTAQIPSLDSNSFTPPGSTPERPVISVIHNQPVPHLMPMPLKHRLADAVSKRGPYDLFGRDLSKRKALTEVG